MRCDVFRIIASDSDGDYGAADYVQMRQARAPGVGGHSWGKEEYHQGIKQGSCAECRQAHKSQAMTKLRGVAGHNSGFSRFWFRFSLSGIRTRR